MSSYLPWRKSAPSQPLPPQTSAAIALRALLPEQTAGQDSLVQAPKRPAAPTPTAGQLVEIERPASRGATNPRYISLEALAQEHQRRAEVEAARAQELAEALEATQLILNSRYSTQPPPTILATAASYPLSAIYGVGNALRATPGVIINAPWTVASGAHGAATSVANVYGKAVVWWSRPTTPETPINFHTVDEQPSYQHTKRFPRTAGTGNRERGIVLHASKDEFFYIPNMVRPNGTAISFTSRYDRETLSLVYMPDGQGSVETLNNHRTLQLFDAQCLSTVNDIIAQLTHAQSISSRSLWYPARASGWNALVTGATSFGEAVIAVTGNLGISNPKVITVIFAATFGLVSITAAMKTLAVAFREGWHLSKRREIEGATQHLLVKIWAPFLNARKTSGEAKSELQTYKDERPKLFKDRDLQMHVLVHATLTRAIQRIQEREEVTRVPFAQWRREGREQGQTVASSLAGPSFSRRRNAQQITEGNQQ